MKKTEYYLPISPSVNQCYATNWKTKRRFKSKPYEFWLKKATDALWQQKRVFLTAKRKYMLVIELGKMGDKRRRDCFNYEKPATDFLVSNNLIVDDCHIDLGLIRWTNDIQAGVMKITVYELDKNETSDDYEINIERKVK